MIHFRSFFIGTGSKCRLFKRTFFYQAYFSSHKTSTKAGETVKIATIDEIKKKWQTFTPHYYMLDACPQLFYYTLVNMLKINQAKNILEVACGSGKLLPLALDLKSEETTYLATDLSPAMI
jgi:hypothetical protein